MWRDDWHHWVLQWVARNSAEGIGELVGGVLLAGCLGTAITKWVFAILRNQGGTQQNWHLALGLFRRLAVPWGDSPEARKAGHPSRRKFERHRSRTGCPHVLKDEPVGKNLPGKLSAPGLGGCSGLTKSPVKYTTRWRKSLHLYHNTCSLIVEILVLLKKQYWEIVQNSSRLYCRCWFHFIDNSFQTTKWIKLLLPLILIWAKPGSRF